MTRDSEELERPLATENDVAALVDQLGSKAVDILLASNGVHLYSVKESKADLISRFLFSQKWYNRAFSSLDPDERGFSVTGLRAHIEDLTKVRQWAEEAKGKELGRLTHRPKIIEVFDRKGCNFVLRISYTVVRPNRTACLRVEHGHVEVSLHHISGDRYEFRCNPLNSREGMVTRDVVEEILNGGNARQIKMDLEALTPEQSVDLFNDIFDDKKGAWRVRDVCGLTVRSPQNTERDITNEEMKPISHAVLHGTKLNDHSIVKKLLGSGYYFAAAEFWCFKPGETGFNAIGGELKVQINFKKKPEILEVNAGKFRYGPGQDEQTPLNLDYATDATDFYWSQTHDLYNTILADARSGTKRVTRSATKATSAKAPTAAPPPTASGDGHTATPAPGTAPSKATPTPEAAGAASVAKSAATPPPAAGKPAKSAATPEPAPSKATPAPEAAGATIGDKSAATPPPATGKPAKSAATPEPTPSRATPAPEAAGATIGDKSAATPPPATGKPAKSAATPEPTPSRATPAPEAAGATIGDKSAATPSPATGKPAKSAATPEPASRKAPPTQKAAESAIVGTSAAAPKPSKATPRRISEEPIAAQLTMDLALAAPVEHSKTPAKS